MIRIAAVSVALLLLAAPAAEARSDRAAAKAFGRAAKRLRELGVSRRTARLFTADDDAVFAGFDLDSETLRRLLPKRWTRSG